MRSQSIGLKTWFPAVLKWFPPERWAALGLAALCVCPVRADVQNISYSDKIRQHVFFGRPLMWVGETPPSEEESRQLWDAMGGAQRGKLPDLAPGLSEFVKAHPASPWRPAVENCLGTSYRDQGYFSLALDHWEAGWNAAKEMTDDKAIMEADCALIARLQLLASLGRTDTMKTLFDETMSRAMAGPFQGSYSRLEFAYRHMLSHPEDSYRCGTFALNAVGKALYGTNYYDKIVRLPSPESGFSMAGLVEIAASNSLDLVAVERPSGGELVAPSVVHWKENHYAAIVQKKGDTFRVVDPTFRLSRWLSADAINHEASGQFLVPAKQKPAGWRSLTSAECANIFGKGFPGNGWGPAPVPTLYKLLSSGWYRHRSDFRFRFGPRSRSRVRSRSWR